MRTTTIGIAFLATSVLACASGAPESSGQSTGKNPGDGQYGPGTGDPSTDPSLGGEAADVPARLVSNLSLNELAIYQAVKVDVMKGGVWAKKRNAPVVAGRAALLRVFVTPESGFSSRDVTAEVRLVTGGKKLPIVRETKTISRASSDEDIKSTFNLELPEDAIGPDTTLTVALTVPDGEAVRGPSDARFPRDGSPQALGAKPSGKVKVVVVPVRYDADGSGRTPDIGAAQLALYKQTMMARYPAADVDISVRDAFSWTTPISRNGAGFSQILSAITKLRSTDGAAKDVYYYGALAPAPSFGSYCGTGCVTGLSTVVDSAQVAQLRASVGIGFTGTDAADTMAHEVGHAHGRNHAPCGGTNGIDPDFPYSDGTIGVWGYDLFAKTLLAPSKGHDMMGYCPNEWVSDYTFSALFDRISAVNQLVGAQSATGAGNGQNAATRRVRLAIADEAGDLSWSTDAFDAEEPSGGEPRAVRFVGAAGLFAVHQAHFFKFDHLPGGIVVVPEPASAGVAAQASHVAIDGFSRPLAR